MEEEKYEISPEVFEKCNKAYYLGVEDGFNNKISKEFESFWAPEMSYYLKGLAEGKRRKASEKKDDKKLEMKKKIAAVKRGER